MPERADPACRRNLALLIIYYSSITQPKNIAKPIICDCLKMPERADPACRRNSGLLNPASPQHHLE